MFLPQRKLFLEACEHAVSHKRTLFYFVNNPVSLGSGMTAIVRMNSLLYHTVKIINCLRNKQYKLNCFFGRKSDPEYEHIILYYN